MSNIFAKDNIDKLQNKLVLSRQILKSCELCEHRCKTDRVHGKPGVCGAMSQVYVYSEFMHWGIEFDLIPSYAIFFSACSMRCAFCSSLKGLNPKHGIPLDAQLVAGHIDEAEKNGAKTVLFVGGEPTIHPQGILEIAMYRQSEIPFVMDTNLYMTEQVFDLLEGVVGIYLADFKFGNDHCASRIAGIPRYVETLQRNLRLAQTHADLYIRHILLPGHVDCCFKPIVKWISENLPDTKFHLVESYEPAYLWKKNEELQKKISQHELENALHYAHNLHLRLID